MPAKLPKGLDALDMLILGLLRDEPDITQDRIAKKLKRNRATVMRRMKRPEMADAIIDIKGSVEEILEQAKHLAARRMKRLILSKSEAIALKASSEILKANLSPAEVAGGNEVRFVTVVNEVGVLESKPVVEPVAVMIEGDIEDGKDSDM